MGNTEKCLLNHYKENPLIVCFITSNLAQKISNLSGIYLNTTSHNFLSQKISSYNLLGLHKYTSQSKN
jgi:hypothetical protein